MKICLKICTIFAVSLVFFSLASCKSMIVNKVGTAASGADKKGKPVQKKEGGPDPMLAFMGEKDVTIVSEVLPAIVKMYEILALEAPEHDGLQITAGSLNVMYGNLCVQAPAEKLGIAELDRQVEEFNRAKYHYLRGRQYILDAFERRWPGFTKDFLSDSQEAAEKAAEHITKDDVNAAYWCGGASLIAWSLDPLDVEMLSSIKGPVALLEKAAALDPEYSGGAIWDALAQFYAAAPMDFGGDYEKGLYCYEQALKLSGGTSAGLYITHAETFRKPAGDKAGYIEDLNKALSIDVDKEPAGRLMNVMNQQKAKWLLDHVDDYFVEW